MEQTADADSAVGLCRRHCTYSSNREGGTRKFTSDLCDLLIRKFPCLQALILKTPPILKAQVAESWSDSSSLDDFIRRNPHIQLILQPSVSLEESPANAPY